MDNLRNIATTYYQASSAETKKFFYEFFKALDNDGDGMVDYYEFKRSLKEQGYKDYAYSDLFMKLDKNGDKLLDYWEVMTLYYVIMSGRPFCTGCQMFIPAEYFVCVECFEKSSAPIYLCPNCYEYKNPKFNHSHNNKKAQFLDTYALLEYQRLSALSKNGGHQVVGATTTFTSSSSHTPYSPYSSSSLAIVPSSSTTGRLRDSRALKTFETVLGLANLKVGLLSLGIQGCTIM